ncbi:hypothetical protein ACLOJK_034810 [Asimina triloba]
MATIILHAGSQKQSIACDVVVVIYPLRVKKLVPSSFAYGSEQRHRDHQQLTWCLQCCQRGGDATSSR